MDTQERSPSGLVSRRRFTALAAAAAAMAAFGAFPGRARASAAFPAPGLPYPENALEPVISAKTLSFHHGKHTAAYYANLNKMLDGKPTAGLTLEKVILDAAKDPAQMGLFNNAAQAWNHTFYFQCLKSGGGGEPSGRLAEKLNAAFGSFAAFRGQFVEAAMSQFGSGWAWLVAEGDALKVVKTPNAGNPMTSGQKPLFTVDVWEHAYYLDYQNRRKDYVEGVLDKLANWDFAAKNLG